MIELSTSSLATYQATSSTGNCNYRTSQISGIVIHNAATVGTCSDLHNILNSTTAGSFNYGIATDGTIGVYLDEIFRPWSTGNPEIDHKTVSIVVCNSSLSSNYPISVESYASLVELCADICYRNSIPQLKYTGLASTSNLYKHSWYNSNVSCPGQYISSKYNKIVQDVNELLKSRPTNTSTAASLKYGVGVSVDKINPYVACIEPNAVNINYSNLIKSKVVGVLFYCGGLYDSAGTRRNTYQSSTLLAQLKLLNSAMPYGLYCDVRAKDQKQAKEECKQLYYVLAKYPPKLGIWLKLNLGSSKTTNDSILNTYYQYLTQWGLSSKCGIYCSRSQLSSISWTNNFSSKYSLLIVDHQKSLNDLESLITPEFFKV